jgi:hypothetical protein
MVKYFKDMSGLVLVGDLPKWYTGEFIPYRDIAGRVDYNMYAKLMAGAKGETVLYTQDDVFALKPFDQSIPNYYSGTCGEKALTSASGRHRTQYKNCPKEWLNFDIHVPMVIDTSKFTWSGNYLHNDRPVKSNYAGQNSLPGTHLCCDVKFGNAHTYEQIKSIIDEKPFFSTSPFCMNAAMVQVLQELFPDKSIYEK